jgi:hypothetical protein
MRQLSHGPVYREIAGLVWKAREPRVVGTVPIATALLYLP